MSNIVLLEDDVWLADLEVRVLTKAGYEVRVAHHGASAMELIETQAPDALIVDMLLAGSTVFTLLHELQSYQDTAQIPVILCTNLAEQVRPEQLKAYGIRRVLDKTTMQPGDIVTALKALEL